MTTQNTLPSPNVPELPSRERALVERTLARDMRSGARVMRAMDDDRESAERMLRALFPHTGHADLIGITGNPGSGKSTLTNELVRHYRAEQRRVGVVCVDPSSPFSGGAILGDRIRMLDHATDEDVFIRSVATRGALGGLSRSTHDIALVLDAMGFDPILVETVGVGQDEIDVMRLVHTNVVVTVPGMGDDIQAIKAGILEIADVFVVNKSDHPMADRAAADLRHLQSLAPTKLDWVPPIVRTVATRREGIAELAAAIATHNAFIGSGVGSARHSRERQREEQGLLAIIEERLWNRVQNTLQGSGLRDELLRALLARTTDPYTAADRVIATFT